MSEEMKNAAVETEVVENKAEEIDVNEAPKTEEAKPEKKENVVVRGLKAVGNGLVKTGKAIGGAVKKHPFIASAITGAIGYGIRAGIDYLAQGSVPAEAAVEAIDPIALPEAEEPAAIDISDLMETENEDVKAEA